MLKLVLLFALLSLNDMLGAQVQVMDDLGLPVTLVQRGEAHHRPVASYRRAGGCGWSGIET